MGYVPRKPLPDSIVIRHERELTSTERASARELVKKVPGPGSERLVQAFDNPDVMQDLGLHGVLAFDKSKNKPVGVGFFAPAFVVLMPASSFSRALFDNVEGPLTHAGVDLLRLAYFGHFLVEPEYAGRGIGSHLLARRLELARQNRYTNAFAVIERNNTISRRLFGRGLEPITSFEFEGKTLDVFLRSLSTKK